MDSTICPPGRSAASNTTGRYPKVARSWAQASPAGPEPITATRSLRGGAIVGARR